MSVLVQRPQQIPGLISLPRQHMSSTPRRNPPLPSSRSSQSTVPAPLLSPKVNRRQRGQSHQQAPPIQHSSTPPNSRSSKRRSHNNLNSNTSNSASVSSPGNPSATVSASESPVLSAFSSPTNSKNTTAPATIKSSIITPPVQNQSLPVTTPRKSSTRSHNQAQSARSAPNTPSPANSLPVPANRRRARSPRPTAKLPPVFPGVPVDEDSLEGLALALGSANQLRGRKANTPGSINLSAVTLDVANDPFATSLVVGQPTWQQAALFKKPHVSGAVSTGSVHLLNPFDASVVSTLTTKGGFASTPTSPTRVDPNSNHGPHHTLAHSPTMPSFSAVHHTLPRKGVHARAPSVPSYPTFPSSGHSTLDALFSSAMTLESTASSSNLPALSGNVQNIRGHTRGASVSSSLPHASSIHTRMASARRERTLTGGMTTSPSGKFAGASFQTAPDAMVLPMPGFLKTKFSGFGMLSGGSSSSEEDTGSSEEIVDLSVEESADEDEVVFTLV